MSFAPVSLAVLAYANGFTLWHYETDDDARQLVAPDYFVAAGGMLRRGDLIFSSCLMSGTKKTGLFLVTHVSEHAVAVDSLHSATAEDLSNLNDVTLQEVQPSHVLAYDGAVWVNQSNPGFSGDHHAQLGGNPHGTSAADIGAVPLSEKGRPAGVATLDADGLLTASQLRTWALAQLRDVIAGNPVVGDILRFDGSRWVSAPEAGRTGDAFAVAHDGAGDGAHALATPLAAGFLAAADKQKLDTVHPGAAPNPPAAAETEVVIGTGLEPRLFTPAQIKLAASIHAPAGGGLPPALVGNAQLAPVEPATLKGRDAGEAGSPEDLSAERVRALLGVEAGATAAGAHGDAFAASHGGQGGGAHAEATATEAGFLSAADKRKLDGLVPGAGSAPPMATTEELTAATVADPRSFSPAQIKAAVQVHVPPLAPDSIDNVALANMAAARVKGRPAGAGLGDPQDLTAAQVRTLINVQDGATAAGAAGDAHAAALGNPHATTAAQVGAIAIAEKGAADGVATLDATGKVPAAQLPPATGGGAVASVFGRTGTVVPHAGDYSADQVTETVERRFVSAAEKARLAEGSPTEVPLLILSTAGNAYVMTDATAAIQRTHQNSGARLNVDLTGVAGLTFRGRVGVAGPAGFRVAVIFSLDRGTTWLYSDGTPANTVPPANGWSAVLATALDATTPSPFAVTAVLHESLRRPGTLIDIQTSGGDGVIDPSIRNGVVVASGFRPAAETGGGGAVASVFGRTGTVVPQAGDYRTDQVTETETRVFMTAAERTKLATVEASATRAGTAGDAHATASGNPHRTTAADVGAIPASDKGAAGGVASLDATGKVPAAQLPGGSPVGLPRSATDLELYDGTITESRLISPAQLKSVIRYYGLIGVGDSQEAFLASDPTLPHGGVRASNTGEQNAEADDALWTRVRASSATRRFVQYPCGRLDFARTWSPSGRLPGKGLRADDITVDFPGTTIRCAPGAPPSNFMAIQLCDDGGAFRDMDSFGNTKDGQQVPWSKDRDTVWIDPVTGNLRKMRLLLNIRNCEKISITGSLIVDGNNVAQMVGLGSSGGNTDGGGRTGMMKGSIQSIIFRNIAVGMMAGNFGASATNTGIADHFTDATFGQFVATEAVRVAMVGHSNHFDNVKFLGCTTACSFPSYICNTHNLSFGPGFWNAPASMVPGHAHALITMGTNITFTGIYFNSGSEPSNGHMLFGDRSTIRIQYHNDISKGTTTGAHLRVGRTPSGANCLSADICAQVDIRSANGVQPPPGGGWGPNPTWPGMLAIDALGDVRCRRIIELRCGALRNDYDIVKIAPGSTATNDKISIFDARDDANFGRARKIAGGALVLA